MSLLFLFIDGVGIGPSTPANPVAGGAGLLALTRNAIANERLTGLPDGWEGAPLDATLDVPGLPQSATGQATLFTGVNAAKHLGHHQSALPGPTLRRLLVAKSFVRFLTREGHTVTFANAFRRGSAEGLDGPLPRRVSASTIAFWASGARFRTPVDVRRGRAVFHDVTGAALGALDPTVSSGSPEDAGDALARLASEIDFVFFEHFETDLIGHGRIDREPTRHLAMLDRLICRATDGLDPDRDGVLIVSDHGNLEDMSTSGHTLNPVPFLVWGRARRMLDAEIRSLTGVAPAVRRWMTTGGRC